MRFSPRPIASLGVLAVAATVATGLMLGPTAYADPQSGQGAATAASSGSLYA
ncbi:hypothetical protein [Actinomadura sp. KC216]|uniref:hypothetical protein n=1 Tax=Actinomadura sp. KC216 TaxID=2530370 RepID=UPI00140514CA|nr:hypothetical protein [Actinomadura sp. KC216]